MFSEDVCAHFNKKKRFHWMFSSLIFSIKTHVFCVKYYWKQLQMSTGGTTKHICEYPRKTWIFPEKKRDRINTLKCEKKKYLPQKLSERKLKQQAIIKIDCLLRWAENQNFRTSKIHYGWKQFLSLSWFSLYLRSPLISQSF